MSINVPAFLAALALTVLNTAGAAEAPTRFTDGVLVDAKGMTLYTFDNDVAGSGKSVCNGPCASLWPPAPAAAGSARPSGPLGLVTRDDGSLQWSYQGKPIYTYLPDHKPGERSGDGFKGVWHVIKE